MSAQRRPPVKKVATARLRHRPEARGTLVRSRPEGIRWLRADGTPNWSQYVSGRREELRLLATNPAVSIPYTSTVLEAAEVIASKGIRGMPLVDSREKLKGVVLATDIVNYLGGGEYYNIVLKRHRSNMYSALRGEPVFSISNPTPAYAMIGDTLDKVLEIMVGEGIGLIPVLYDDGTVYGVITEHDIVRHLALKKIGKQVKDYMTTTIVTVEAEHPLRKAAEAMSRHGFRRLPVTSGGLIKGMITAKDYVRYFGSHDAFKNVTTGDIKEVLETPVYEVMTPEVYTIDENADIGEAASAMIAYKTSSLLAVNSNGKVTGIITERDVLLSIVLA